MKHSELEEIFRQNIYLYNASERIELEKKLGEMRYDEGVTEMKKIARKQNERLEILKKIKA